MILGIALLFSIISFVLFTLAWWLLVASSDPLAGYSGLNGKQREISECFSNDVSLPSQQMMGDECDCAAACVWVRGG